jgi:hypothetical protein
MKFTYVHLYLFACFFAISSIEGIQAQDDIQKVHIGFTMPNGSVRQLLLGFTPNDVATDGIDYGYDALNIDTFQDDLNWMIEEKRYVIQGVGSFNDSKKYPLGLFLKNSGTIKIDLKGTYNFETPIDIFVYDALLETYTRINEATYTDSMGSGTYLDRFYLSFKDESITSALAKTSLSTTENTLENARISYLTNTKELYINTNSNISINNISLFNILGQNIMSLNQLNSKVIKIPMHGIKETYGIESVTTDKGIITKKLFLN